MAVRSLVNCPCYTPDEVFRHIRDFIVAENGIADYSASGGNPGPGYEIVDSSYASGDPSVTTTNDWCVLRTNGESETYPHYIKIGNGASYHTINIYLHWDATTHSGWAGTSRSNNIYHNGSGESLLCIYADLDEMHIVIRPVGITRYYWEPFGRLGAGRTYYSGEAAYVAAATAAGADTVIALESWPSWAAVGRKIYHWDTSGLGEVEITAVDPIARTIVVTSYAARAAGSWMAEDLLLFARRSYSDGVTTDLDGLPQRSVSVAVRGYAFILQGSSMQGVDAKYDHRTANDLWIYTTNEIRGRLRLVRQSRAAVSTQGEAWVDDEGNHWRLHTVYSDQNMAFREA